MIFSLMALRDWPILHSTSFAGPGLPIQFSDGLYICEISTEGKINTTNIDWSIIYLACLPYTQSRASLAK